MTMDDLKDLTNGDLVRFEFESGTAVEGRFMHNNPKAEFYRNPENRNPKTDPEIYTEGPYLWLYDGIRVIDIYWYFMKHVKSMTVLEKWDGKPTITAEVLEKEL